MRCLLIYYKSIKNVTMALIWLIKLSKQQQIIFKLWNGIINHLKIGERNTDTQHREPC